MPNSSTISLLKSLTVSKSHQPSTLDFLYQLSRSPAFKKIELKPSSLLLLLSMLPLTNAEPSYDRPVSDKVAMILLTVAISICLIVSLTRILQLCGERQHNQLRPRNYGSIEDGQEPITTSNVNIERIKTLKRKIAQYHLNYALNLEEHFSRIQCIVNNDIMENPTIIDDGHSYEVSVANTLKQQKAKCPQNLNLNVTFAKPNIDLAITIDEIISREEKMIDHLIEQKRNAAREEIAMLQQQALSALAKQSLLTEKNQSAPKVSTHHPRRNSMGY